MQLKMTDDDVVPKFPVLFQSADEAARKQQNLYFGLLILQFLILVSAAMASALLRDTYPQLGSWLYFFCLISGALATLCATLMAPERDWYFARALAESTKSLSWLYMMAAEPFGRKLKPNIAVNRFTSALSYLLKTNRDSGRVLSLSVATGSQVTADMERVRFLELRMRKNIYLEQRIDNQLFWYTENARANSMRSKFLGYASVGVYIVGIVIAMPQLATASEHVWSIKIDWLTEPLIVVATSVIGWSQARRYSELAATYSLATHEIAQLRENVVRVSNEVDFSRFVRDSEAAFSREHTQWAARQIGSFGSD